MLPAQSRGIEPTDKEHVMSLRSRSSVCFALALCVGSLALAGCPKRPEVGQAGPGAVGPAAATGAPLPTAQAVPPVREAAVAQVPAVREAPVVQVVPREVTVTPPPASPPIEPVAPAPATAAPAPTVAPSAAAPAEEAKPTARVTDVFFDFDRSGLRPDQQAAVQALVARLQQHRQATVTVEGYCDERGSSEYNLALGERRAKTVRDALLKAGIGAGRIAVVSYGEERPFISGKDESAWKWNRRAHVVLSGQ
jgi:peptidoglycan-associated lipoprotein